MGDVTLKCPLCCNNTFSSRVLLVEHLNNILGNLFCPICNTKWSSVIGLTEHMSHENCLQAQTGLLQPDQLGPTLEETSEHQSKELQLKDASLLEFKNATQINTIGIPSQNIVGTEDVSHMYEELIKSTQQSHDLQFVKDNSDQYLILTQEPDGRVVTKQNNDGTISLTTVKDNMKMELHSPDPTPEPAPEPEEELYSCNTCGVSFSSVMEHIQNYHNDQDVVVEEPMDEGVGEPIPIEFDTVVAEENVNEKLTSRRVITDMGSIVETTMNKTETEGENEDYAIQAKHQVKVAGPGSKRYMRMNNLCDSVVRNLKQSEKNGLTHKVMVKEVVAKDGEKIKYYHCVYCNVNVSSLSDFKMQPCKITKYSCLQCPVSYDNAKSLCAHMKVHKVKTTEVIDTAAIASFECETCCTVFPSNKSLKLHKRMHFPVKSRKLEAPKNSNFSDIRFQCTICEKMIPVDYKTVHENSHLNEQHLLNCGICNKKFNSEEYLEMHMNVHSLEKAPRIKADQSLPYNCVYCDRRFARPHEKVKHERIHTGEKPHSCEICGKSFRVSYCLTLHMRTHTGARPYACQHCGKRFKAHSVYNHHLLTHSEVRAYKCPYCPKAFKTSVQLAGHKNSHTKPFSCTHCNRPFASLYAVRVHTETHARQNNLKFSCALCGASYARAFALKDHIKQQHKDEDVVKCETSVSVEDWVSRDKGGTIRPAIDALEKDLVDPDEPMSNAFDELIVPN